MGYSRVVPMSLLRLDPPMAPPWVGDALGASAPEGESFEKDGVSVVTRGAKELLLVRAAIPGAAELDDRGFRNGVARCYAAVIEMARQRELVPLRFWNFIPDIRRASDDGFSRYEVFNAGRHRGFATSFPGDERAGRVTASGVGHPGRDFVLHLLAGRQAAIPVENPRQRASYRYSERYGHTPPCFSRASRIVGGLGRLPGGSLGLVAGTASIVGEDSRHPGDLDAQLAETFLNLAAVAGEVVGRPLAEAPGEEALQGLRACYRELRLYLAREDDAPAVEQAVRSSFPGLARFDMASARLCRPELLVEAEGLLRWES